MNQIRDDEVPLVGNDPELLEAFYREHNVAVKAFFTRPVDDPHPPRCMRTAKRGSTSRTVNRRRATIPCGGLGNMPFDAKLRSDDYVITIPADSVLRDQDAVLQITTSGDVADQVAGLMVAFSVGDVECGFGTASASVS